MGKKTINQQGGPDPAAPLDHHSRRSLSAARPNGGRRIIVDADACPFKDVILEIASAHGFAVTLVANYCHEIRADGAVEVVRVDKEPDAVDIAVANRAAPGDIVVTQDYGLAAMVLGKGARALSPRGKIYTNGNIEGLLAERHLAQKARRAGRRTKGPPPLGRADRECFRRALQSLAGQ